MESFRVSPVSGCRCRCLDSLRSLDMTERRVPSHIISGKKLRDGLLFGLMTRVFGTVTHHFG